MDGEKKKWTRAGGKKVKTGCRTCKTRRIKCDEHKPECFRCQLSKHKCGGYDDPDAIVDRRKKGHSRSTNRSLRPLAVSSLPPMTIIDVGIVGDPDERRSFHHFRVRTAQDLSGCFDSNFWDRLVLQLCHSEPAIRHALIALGAAHESFQAGVADSFVNPSLALRQYNKAIGLVNQKLSNPSRRDIEVTLVCCLLFVCIESIRGNYDIALVHLKNGIGILKGKGFDAGRDVSKDVPYLDPQTDEDDLVEVFMRLDVSATAFLDTQPAQLGNSLSESLPDFATHPFRTFAEARNCLQRLVGMVSHLTLSQLQYRDIRNSLPVEAEAERCKLISAVRNWAIQFDAFLKRPDMAKLSGRNLQGAFTLIAQQKTLLVILSASPFSDMRVLLNFESEIESIVSIATWLVNQSGPPPDYGPQFLTTGKTQPEAVDYRIFTVDMGIIAPLYYVVMNYPDFSIRKQALELLKIPRREGLWDSVLISNIAEKSADVIGQRIVDSFGGSISVTELAAALGATSNSQA